MNHQTNLPVPAAANLPLPGLIERLRGAAELWAEATNSSLSALASAVLNDSGYFARIAGPSASTTTRTLEKFARFLTDPANWPEGAAPEEVCAFAHAVGVSGPACAASPDSCAGNIGQVQA